MIEFLQRQSRHLYPGYFAMVMATGALSLSLWYLDFHITAELLMYFNVFIFVFLIILNGLRLLFNTKDSLQDLNDNGKGPGFFTLIAASAVLGSQFVIIKGLMLEIFIKGFTLFYWALGTWWIPLLITLGVWRHIVNRYPLSYTPEMWGMAFPIAMYTVGTVNLSLALDLEFLMIIPRITIIAAVGVWLLIMIGLIVHHSKRVKHT